MGAETCLERHFSLIGPQDLQGELFILFKPGLLCAGNFPLPNSLGGFCYCCVCGSLQFKTSFDP